MSDVLDRICAYKREEIAARKNTCPLSVLEQRASEQSPVRGFQRALQTATDDNRFGLICEIKKASPSKGLIRADFDPPALARAYREGGATCLSVLTDAPSFQGHEDFLIAAHNAVDLPILRKDFMLDPYQIAEARAIGADCILLIMAALENAEAHDLEQAAQSFGLDVLIEVHNEAELDRAVKLNSKMIGINNRNLKTMTVDLATTERLAPMLATNYLVVGESGLGSHADLVRLSKASVNCFLVGESLMRQDDVAAATRTLLGP